MLPVWQKAVQPYVDSGQLAVLGVVQEQHPDRARLYKQWRQLDWPIAVDSLNLLDLAAVPVPVAIDEFGIVRLNRPSPASFAKEFLEQDYTAVNVPQDYNRAEQVDPVALHRAARQGGSAVAYRALGDACFTATESNLHARAVWAYQKAIEIEPRDGRVHFRLGVALRRRSEGARRKDDDAQAAVASWGEALAINPNQYIWRRRIQQYGPRLDKPYDFYSWVAQARDDIKARGEEPIVLATEPAGSELIAPPRRRRKGRSASGPLSDGRGAVAEMKNPDPQGKINRDKAHMVNIEVVVTPARVQPGQRVRVRTTFRLHDKSRPYWNNEAREGLAMWVDPPKSCALGEGRLTYTNPPEAESQETRILEFELAVNKDAPPGEVTLPAYALYYVCQNKGGKCLYLRQDFDVRFVVDPQAPKIQ